MINIQLASEDWVNSGKTWENATGFTAATTVHPRWNDSGNPSVYGTDNFNLSLFGNGYSNADGSFGTGPTNIIGGGGFFWTSTEQDSTTATRYSLYASYTSMYLTNNHGKFGGYSIRLLRDATIDELLLTDGTIINDAYSDYEGHIYSGTKINNKIWLRENLYTKFYSNGDSILTFGDDDGQGRYVFQSFDGMPTIIPEKIYGLLYNFHVIPDSRGFIMTGSTFSVPQSSDISDLINYINETNSIAGNILKSTREVNSPYIIPDPTHIQPILSEMIYVNAVDFKSLIEYPDNATAISSGLTVGQLYTTTGSLKIVY